MGTREIVWGAALGLGLLVACSDESANGVADASTNTGGSGGGSGGAGAMDAAMAGGSGGSGGTTAMRDAATIDAADSSEDDAAIDEGDAAVLSPHPQLAELEPGEAVDLGAFDCTAPNEEEPGWCRAVTDYSGLVYDGVQHQLLMFGGGHATTMTDTIFTFDLDDTLRWSELYEPTPCELMVASNLDAELGAWNMGSSGPYPRPLAVHTYDLNAFSPEQNEFIMISRSFTGGYCNTVGNDVGGPIAHYDLEQGTWSFSDVEPSASIATSERDPMTGLIVVLGSDGLKLYDPSARTYTDEVESLADAAGGSFDVPSLGYANHLVYFPPTDTFYYFMRGQPVQVVALKLNRAAPASSTLERIATEGPTSPHEEPGYDYDSVNRVIGGGVHDDTFYELDPMSGRWTAHPITGAQPGSQAFHAIAYDPASHVFVFRSTDATGEHSWAFRLR